MTIHATKLHRPRPRANWIDRPRLLTLLHRGLDDAHRLILVSAPAGAGKTTLLGHWLAERPTRAAWLSLDAEDDEPVRFWTCMLHALQSIVPGLGRDALAALASPTPPPLSSLLPDLLNEIGAQAEPLILVLDDYHVLTAKAIHDSVATAVDHLPEQMHVVICTRADPPLPLPRWRARGELIEVRAADLRFTTPEALAFLNQRMDLNLQLEDAEQLVARTEGWAVGLQLAGLSLQGQADPRGAIRSFAGSRHYMLEYLLEEVLARQPPTMQRFLLYTSILTRMCGPLCDAVTGAEQGAATLLDLQRQNLFVVPLDEERFWFRYHHLFADLLRARLHQVAPDQVRDLHLRASIWYEQNGASVEAVHHALAGRAWERAAHLLEAHEHDWWTGSDLSMMNLLPHLPDEVVLRGPNLSVYKAWFLLINGQLQSASTLLATVKQAIVAAQNGAGHRDLLGFVALQQAYIAELSGSPRPQPVDPSALSHIAEDRGGMRNSAEVLLAYVLYRDGNFAAAEPLLQATIARDVRTGATNGIPISTSRLARMWITAGRLQDAAQICRTSMAIVEERQAQGQEPRALSALEQALALAAPMECIRIFLDEQPGALALVDAINRRRSVPQEVQAFARKVIASATQHGPVPVSTPASGATTFPSFATAAGAAVVPPLVEALTTREQEVLTLVAAGCSNRDIAERLVITLHAVKKHTGNIYGKLGVTSRTQAIVRARDLGLLL